MSENSISSSSSIIYGVLRADLHFKYITKSTKFTKYRLQNEEDYYDIHLIFLGYRFSRTDTHRNKIRQHQHYAIFWLQKGKREFFFMNPTRDNTFTISLQQHGHGQTDLSVHRHVCLVRPVQAVRPAVCSNALHATIQTFSLCLLANLSLMLSFDFFTYRRPMWYPFYGPVDLEIVLKRWAVSVRGGGTRRQSYCRTYRWGGMRQQKTFGSLPTYSTVQYTLYGLTFHMIGLQLRSSGRMSTRLLSSFPIQ
jgi:hypothetical protein